MITANIDGQQHLLFAGNASPFSNFNPAPVQDDAFGQRWPTSEHAFMARKAAAFGDQDALARLRQAHRPQEAKAIGREVRGFDAASWRGLCEEAMLEVLRLKFSQNPAHRRALLETGEQVLVEAAPWDRLWGIGMDAEAAQRTPRRLWGENLLGRALMQVRQELRAADELPEGAQ